MTEDLGDDAVLEDDADDLHPCLPTGRSPPHFGHTSGSTSKKLKRWLQAQLDEKLIEPNSGLGDAICYSLKHWDKLSLFLFVPGAPLDNNICYAARGITSAKGP